MQTISLGGCTITIGAGAAMTLNTQQQDTQVITICSPNTQAHAKRILPQCPSIVLTDTEANKTLASIASITHELLLLGADRHSHIVAVGGGIICDIAAFAAAIYMRGIGCTLVPTTLLAQVDAAIGGKNGINVEGYKNILGTFRQPQRVCCDLHCLATLPARAYAAGFAEVIKAAVIASSDLFDYLESHADTAMQRQHDALEHIIACSVMIKASIVEQDEREHGKRRLLNLGHTFAHAIEKISALPHGEAVSIGMCLASAAAVRLGLMQECDARRLESLLHRFALPTSTAISVQDMLPAILHDKKKQRNSLPLILPQGIGVCTEMLINAADIASLF
jgi:3-dehydroquinate synthase